MGSLALGSEENSHHPLDIGTTSMKPEPKRRVDVCDKYGRARHQPLLNFDKTEQSEQPQNQYLVYTGAVCTHSVDKTKQTGTRTRTSETVSIPLRFPCRSPFRVPCRINHNLDPQFVIKGQSQPTIRFIPVAFVDKRLQGCRQVVGDCFLCRCFLYRCFFAKPRMYSTHTHVRLQIILYKQCTCTSRVGRSIYRGHGGSEKWLSDRRIGWRSLDADVDVLRVTVSTVSVWLQPRVMHVCNLRFAI